MLMAWMILATLLHSASLAIWFGLFALSFLAFDSGATVGAVFFVTAVGIYAPIALGTIIWAWITLSKEKNRRAGLIMLIPIGYVALFILVAQIGEWIQS